MQLCRDHLAGGKEIRALVINTGIANAGTGEPGRQAAQATCEAVGELLGVAPDQVLPFSTGVILENLPVDRIRAGLPAALADLRADNWHAAAHAIMTTDTVAKAASRTVAVNGKKVIDYDTLRDELERHEVGTEVILTLLREGGTVDVRTPLEAMN